MKINQMKKDEFFEGFYLIKSAEVRQTRAGKDYLALTFQDDTGEISGNVWDAQPGKIGFCGRSGGPCPRPPRSVQQHAPGQPNQPASAPL